MPRTGRLTTTRPDPIPAARRAASLARRAAARHGPRHPAVRAALHLAAALAARVWDTGHRVTALHPAPTSRQEHS
ncbi:hypothetical protein [Streptomyces calidiresistens]|uniref:hypothetical protein n=1 Tax=Streptomyces calidiresistens TaxID=1485586 RepID=UPI002B219A4B|nr:hypothetical protein [Streptomyces calidiresistens]